MEFSRQEYWSELPFPPSGDLPDPGIKPSSPILPSGFFATAPPSDTSVQFSHSVVSDSLQPHGLEHTRPPVVYSNSCPLSWWCHPAISASVIPFSFFQSFPAAASFLMSQFCASGGRSIGISASASVLPINIQDWFPLGWTGWISFIFKYVIHIYAQTHTHLPSL